MDAFEAVVGAWLAQTGGAPDGPIALDGKTLRGVHGHREVGEYVPGVHLVAAYAHGAQAVLTQVLTQVPLAGRVVTGDALLTQRERCTQIVAGGDDVVVPVKENQAALRDSLARAFSPQRAGSRAAPTGPVTRCSRPGTPTPWRKRVARTTRWRCVRPSAAIGVTKCACCGRSPIRWCSAAVSARAHGSVGAPWPHLAQVGRIERRRTVSRRGQVHSMIEVSYAITSLPPERASARTLLGHLRGHWGIENKAHWVRDVTFDEDRSQVRTGAAPQVMAALRNLVLALLRRAGHPNIAAALRTRGIPTGDAGRPADAVAVVLSGGQK